MDQELNQRISTSILRIRTANPFFGTLALFADIEISKVVESAATNGKNIYINQQYCARLSSRELTGLLLHEILHCALEHVTRRGPRNADTWNVAADIVVNAMIRDAGDFVLPDGAVEDAGLAHLSTEEVYARLLKSDCKRRCPMPDLDASIAVGAGKAGGADEDIVTGGAIADQRRREIAARWRMARSQAATIARKYDHSIGDSAGNEWRELQLLDEPQLDWRTLLWEHLARTPSDFSGFDRRFVGRGIYLDALESESLDLYIAIDTSASIDDKQLAEFLTEVIAVVETYPRATAKLYFADTDLYGPHELAAEVQMPRPKGGGGTSFRPFFKELDRQVSRGDGQLVAIYFTDGYGVFPKAPQDFEVLWLVTDDGAENDAFPFGTVVRFEGVAK